MLVKEFKNKKEKKNTMLGLPDEYSRLGIRNYEQDIAGIRYVL